MAVHILINSKHMVYTATKSLKYLYVNVENSYHPLNTINKKGAILYHNLSKNEMFIRSIEKNINKNNEDFIMYKKVHCK